MAYAVKYQHEKYGSTLQPGDVLVSNHPIAGGTHLPGKSYENPLRISMLTATRYYRDHASI